MLCGRRKCKGFFDFIFTDGVGLPSRMQICYACNATVSAARFSEFTESPRGTELTKSLLHRPISNDSRLPKKVDQKQTEIAPNQKVGRCSGEDYLQTFLPVGYLYGERNLKLSLWRSRFLGKVPPGESLDSFPRSVWLTSSAYR